QLAFEAFDYGSAAPHMRFLAGGPPQASAAQPEAAITQRMAESLDLAVGDIINSTQFGDHSIKLNVVVSGIWQPVDLEEAYWNGYTFASGSSNPVVYPILVTYDAFFGQLPRFASVGMRQEWIFYTLPERLNDANIASVSGSLGSLRAHLDG